MLLEKDTDITCMANKAKSEASQDECVEKIKCQLKGVYASLIYHCKNMTASLNSLLPDIEKKKEQCNKNSNIRSYSVKNN